MRSKLVVTTATAALVAGTVLAFAQGTQQLPGGATDRSGSQMQTQTPSQPGMGQGQREQGKGTTGQSQRESQQAPSQREGQGMQQGAQPGGSQAGGGNVTLTSDQRTKIRQSVLQGGNAPRVSNVNFSLTVGTVVPTTVQVVEVPAPLLEIRPEWRGHLYFVVGDQIVIVDRNHHIIAVLSV